MLRNAISGKIRRKKMDLSQRSFERYDEHESHIELFGSNFQAIVLLGDTVVCSIIGTFPRFNTEASSSNISNSKGW